jgi:4-amino-4-deoxy-L-arabinose transferase-like glycosyltransferase
LAGFLIILALAGGIRFYSVFSESLSGDEIYQRLIITQPYLQQVSSLRTDIVHPPFYYWLGRAVSSVAGFGQFGLRLPSALFGLLTVALTMLLGIRLFRDNRVALAAGLLVALSDWPIVVSHFARSYAMLSALVLLYTLVLLRVLERGEGKGAWWILTGLSLLLAYSHYFSWLYFIALLPVVLMRGSRKAIGRWAASLTATALLALPWTVYVLPTLTRAGGIHTVLAWIRTPTLRDFVGLYAGFTGPAGSRTWIAISCAAGLVCLTAAVLAGRRANSGSEASQPDRATASGAPAALWSLAVIPPVLLFILAVPLKYPVWGIRHLVPVQAVWALLLAYGAARLAPRRRLVFPAAVLVLAGLQVYASSDGLFHYWFEPFAPAARVLKDGGQPSPESPLYAMELRHSQIMGFYLGSEKDVFWLGKKGGRLPRKFFLVYRPNLEKDAARVGELLDSGYQVRLKRDFIKRPGDRRGLRLVFLERRHRRGRPGPGPRGPAEVSTSPKHLPPGSDLP